MWPEEKLRNRLLGEDWPEWARPVPCSEAAFSIKEPVGSWSVGDRRRQCPQQAQQLLREAAEPRVPPGSRFSPALRCLLMKALWERENGAPVHSRVLSTRNSAGAPVRSLGTWKCMCQIQHRTGWSQRVEECDLLGIIPKAPAAHQP